MKALQILQDLDYQHRLAKYKSLPPYAIQRGTFNDRTANGLTKAILTFLKLKGHMCWRQSSEGRYRPGKEYTDILGHLRQMKGQWLPGTNKGQADVCCIINGTFCALEVKVGKDVQSEIQKQYQQQVQQSGGLYHLARDFESFYEFYQKLMGLSPDRTA